MKADLSAPKSTRRKRNPFDDPVPQLSRSNSYASGYSGKSLKHGINETASPAAPTASSKRKSTYVQPVGQGVVEEPEKPSDGYAEYAQKFGIPFLPTSSADFIASKDTLKATSSATPSHATRKIVEEIHPNQKRESFLRKAGNEAPELAVDTTRQEKEPVIARGTTSSKQVTSQSQERLIRRISRRQPAISQTSQITPPLVRPGLHEIGEPVSTSQSDILALNRLRALDPDSQKITQVNRMKRFAIVPFLSRKGRVSATGNSTEKAASGFALTTLAQALQDAVTEGNLPLAASLIHLGADINFMSVQKKTYHYILGVAVVTGHRKCIDYLLASGSNGVSVDNALLIAYFTNSLDLLPKLLPHTNMYHLSHTDKGQVTPGKPESTSGSSLGYIARDNMMPREFRAAFLEAFMADKRFDHNKVVIQTYDLVNGRLFEFSTLTTLVHQLDVEALRKVLKLKSKTTPSQSTASVQCPTPIQCLRPCNWKDKPGPTLEILKLLEVPKFQLNIAGGWPGEGCVSPLACAVAGGSLEGVKYLLSLGADPECLTFASLDNGRTGWAHTALGWAAFNGWLEICRALVEAGATPWRTNMRGPKQVAPLLLACRGAHFEVVKYLTSLDIRRSMIGDCLDAAIRNDDPRIVEILLNFGARVVPSTWTVLLSRTPPPPERHIVLAMLDLVLAQNYPLTAEAILAAIDKGSFAALSKVLEKKNDDLGFDKNEPVSNWRWDRDHLGDNRKRTCLVYAKEKGKRDFVALLAGHGWLEVVGESMYLIHNI